MRGIVILAWLVCSGCVAPGPAGRLGNELEALKLAVKRIGGELEALDPKAAVHRAGDASTPIASGADTAAPGPVQPEVADHRSPSRFAPPMPGLIEVSADERPAVLTLARDLAAFPAARSADIVLEYGKTTTGLARAAKVLALMEPAARNGIIKTLRPAEIRTLLEMQVVDPLAPPLAPPPAPAATGRAADASANLSPPAADRIESTTATATPRRFVLAGNGTDAWKTLLDTATGVVYNYRGETWVPITRPLQPKPPQPQR